VIVWLPAVTEKLWLTGVAAAQLAFPAWVAWMVQVPAATSVTVLPDTAHTGEVWELKLTVRPDEAVALTVKGAVPRAWLANAPKVIVWLPAVTEKLTDTVTVAGLALGIDIDSCPL
jgi:hypothetical protein